MYYFHFTKGLKTGYLMEDEINNMKNEQFRFSNALSLSDYLSLAIIASAEAVAFIFGDIYEIVLIGLLLVLQIFYTLRQIYRYFYLKRKGTIISNLPYHIESVSQRKKLLVVEYNKVKFYQFKRNYKNIPDSGVACLIVDLNNTNRYNVFIPKND